MKTFKRIVISLAFSLLLFFTISFTTLAADVETQPRVQPNSFATSLDNITDNIDIATLEDYLRENVYNCVTEIDISQFNIPYTSENLGAISDYIYYDLLEAFHVKGIGASYVVGEPSTLVKLIVTYESGYTKEAYAEKLNQCNLAAEKILNGIIGNNALTDEEKLLLIHDRLITFCEYDHDNYLNNTIPYESYTIYGALVNGKAVCQGYSETYKYLLSKIGIYSEICSSKQLRHAWNIVYLNGTPYHVDITFDDPVPDVKGRVFHHNFLLSDNAIKETGHDVTDAFSGATDTRYDNSFWINISSQIIYIDNELYYINSSDGNLIKYSDKTTLTNTNAAWSKWYYNDAKLATDGRSIYYSGYDSIYKYNLITKTTKIIFTLDSNKYKNYYIEGFTFKNGVFHYELCSTSDYSDTIKSLSFTYIDTDTIPTTPVLIEFDGDLYYYNNGKIDYSETLVSHNNRWYYVNNGKADMTYTGLVCYYNTWYYVENGILNWNYTGLAYHYGGWFYVENSVLNWGYTGLAYHNNAWFYVENGVLNWNYTGLAYYNNSWFYVENGVLNWGYTGLTLYYDTWYYVENGVLNWYYTGLVYHYGGWYYVENGILNWSFVGLTYYCGTWYYVENGVINWNSNTLVYHNGDWYYTANGVVDWFYSGYVNYYGTQYYITNGYLDWSKQ